MKEFEKFKKNLIIITICVFSALTVLLICLAFFIKEQSLELKHVEIAIGILMLIICLIICLLIDKESGVFICPKCGKEFTPNWKQYLLGIHLGSKRKLVCPYCQEKSLCQEKKIKCEDKDE